MIPHRTSIAERPTIINERKRIGDWEADTIVSGKKTGSKASLCTLVERKSRYTKLKKMPDRKPETMNESIRQCLVHLPCESVTYDNGVENKNHMDIRRIFLC